MKTEITLENARDLFTRSLVARNVSQHTITAYATDVKQFITWFSENNIAAVRPDQVEKVDILDYLSYLSEQGATGVTRARKLASLREFFKFLSEQQYVKASPASNIAMPKKEKNSRVFLQPDEYNRLLAASGSNPRDFCILQLFLQTGIRVSELVSLTLEDVDLQNATITINGKGKKQRIIDLEKKATKAIQNYLKQRPNVSDRHLFLNYENQGISDRGVKKLIEKYRRAAGIEKKVSCHSLRHTFATYKAEQGVSPFQLQDWLGHERITTTQVYVHMGRSYAKKAMQQTSL